MNRDRLLRPLCRLGGLLLLAAGALAACSKTVVVTVPPRVDLHAYRTIGVVQFGVECGPPLEREVTHRFLATIQSAQPGVRILELGSEQEVLHAVACPVMDLRAIQSIGKTFGVDAVLTGQMAVSELRPKVSLGPKLASLNARASVDGSLQAKLRETASGATVWTNGAHGTWDLASFGLDAQGMPTHAGLVDPNERHGQMVSELVRVATLDFRPTYERHRVKD